MTEEEFHIQMAEARERGRADRQAEIDALKAENERLKKDTERPILMSGPNIQPILEDRKTHTRRLVSRLAGFGEITEFGKSDTPDYGWVFRDRELRWNEISHACLFECCPYGKPGDRLWVRETWFHQEGGPVYDSAGGVMDSFDDEIIYRADRQNLKGVKWKPSIFMPRWASRLLLEITDVRVERLQDISEEDAIAEGISRETVITGANCNGGTHSEEHAERYFFGGCHEEGFEYPEDAYMALWESINGDGSWDKNPFVWVIIFKRIEP